MPNLIVNELSQYEDGISKYDINNARIKCKILHKQMMKYGVRIKPFVQVSQYEKWSPKWS